MMKLTILLALPCQLFAVFTQLSSDDTCSQKPMATHSMDNSQKILLACRKSSGSGGGKKGSLIYDYSSYSTNGGYFGQAMSSYSREVLAIAQAPGTDYLVAQFKSESRLVLMLAQDNSAQAKQFISPSNMGYAMTAIKGTSLVAQGPQANDASVYDTNLADGSAPLITINSLHADIFTRIREFQRKILLVSSSLDLKIKVFDRTQSTLTVLWQNPVDISQPVLDTKKYDQATSFVYLGDPLNYYKGSLAANGQIDIQFTGSISSRAVLYFAGTNQFIVLQQPNNFLYLFEDSTASPLETTTHTINSSTMWLAQVHDVKDAFGVSGQQLNAFRFYKNTNLATPCTGAQTGCSTCSGTCMGCFPEYQYIASSNSCQLSFSCASTQYNDYSDLTCKPCHGDCLTCSGPGASQCTSCEQNKGLVGGACLECNAACSQCTGVSYQSCQGCNNGFALTGTECRSICLSGFNWLALDNSCQQVQQIPQPQPLPSPQPQPLPSPQPQPLPTPQPQPSPVASNYYNVTYSAELQEQSLQEKQQFKFPIIIRFESKNKQILEKIHQNYKGVIWNSVFIFNFVSSKTLSNNSTIRLLQVQKANIIRASYQANYRVVSYLLQNPELKFKEQFAQIQITTQNPILIINSVQLSKQTLTIKIPASSIPQNMDFSAGTTTAVVVQSVATASLGANLLFSIIMGNMMGLLFKFFQIIDIIESMKLINIQYGPNVEMAFKIIEKIQIKPNLGPDTIMTDKGLVKMNRAMPKTRGKLSSENELELGFFLRTQPLVFLLLLSIYCLEFSLWLLRRLNFYKERKVIRKFKNKKIMIKGIKIQQFNNMKDNVQENMMISSALTNYDTIKTQTQNQNKNMFRKELKKTDANSKQNYRFIDKFFILIRKILGSIKDLVFNLFVIDALLIAIRELSTSFQGDLFLRFGDMSSEQVASMVSSMAILLMMVIELVRMFKRLSLIRIVLLKKKVEHKKALSVESLKESIEFDQELDNNEIIEKPQTKQNFNKAVKQVLKFKKKTNLNIIFPFKKFINEQDLADQTKNEEIQEENQLQEKKEDNKIIFISNLENFNNQMISKASDSSISQLNDKSPINFYPQDPESDFNKKDNSYDQESSITNQQQSLFEKENQQFLSYPIHASSSSQAQHQQPLGSIIKQNNSTESKELNNLQNENQQEKAKKVQNSAQTHKIVIMTQSKFQTDQVKQLIQGLDRKALLKYELLKYYPAVFLTRFYVLVVLVTSLQYSQFFQITMIFIFQLAYSIFWVLKLRKYKFIKRKITTVSFYCLEVSLLVFTCMLFVQKVIGIAGVPGLGIQLVYLVSLLSAFLVEIVEFIYLVIQMILQGIRYLIQKRKYCLTNKNRKLSQISQSNGDPQIAALESSLSLKSDQLKDSSEIFKKQENQNAQQNENPGDFPLENFNALQTKKEFSICNDSNMNSSRSEEVSQKQYQRLCNLKKKTFNLRKMASDLIIQDDQQIQNSEIISQSSIRNFEYQDDISGIARDLKISGQDNQGLLSIRRQKVFQTVYTGNQDNVQNTYQRTTERKSTIQSPKKQKLEKSKSTSSLRIINGDPVQWKTRQLLQQIDEEVIGDESEEQVQMQNK